MKILYIANHYQQNNDDEGAIYDSLIQLGHEVDRFIISSFSCDKALLDKIPSEKYDFVLFHKLSYAPYINGNFRGVCWYFDPINKGFDSNDEYVKFILPSLCKGFFTDGDFVNLVDKENIFLLRQGLDLSTITEDALFDENKVQQNRNILFIGNTNTIGGYSQRNSYLKLLIERYGDIAHTKYNIFKEDLTEKCLNTKIMLAMPPVTDHYWSNRIYLLAGRGAFVLHPYSSELEKQFGSSIAYYEDFSELSYKIDYFLSHPEERYHMQKIAQSIVLTRHRYMDRCKELIEKMKEEK